MVIIVVIVIIVNTATQSEVMALTASPLSGRRPNSKVWEPASQEEPFRASEDVGFWLLGLGFRCFLGFGLLI